MIFRDTNTSCFECGAQRPLSVMLDENGPSKVFYCPECIDEIARGIVQTGGNIESSGIIIPPFVPDEVKYIPDIDNWYRWEIWWSDAGTYVSAVNGRPIYGTEQFYDFIEELYSISQ